MKKILLVFAILLFIFLTRGGLNLNSYKFSPLEIDKTATRQNYLGDLGKIYRNRYGVFFFNNIYPKLIKSENVFYSSLNSVFIYIPLYALLFYWGFRKKL